MGRIIVPRIVVRPLLPPEGPKIGVRVQSQYLHWQVGRYKERFISGPGGLGKGKIWVPESEGEQHNLILNRFYDALIPTYGFITPSAYAAVGTGSAQPDPTQTGLQNEVARSNRTPSGDYSQANALPDYGVYEVKRVFEFTESQVGGRNLTEWGFGPTSSSSSGTMNRELFRDEAGNPIVLSLDTDQRLRLIYRYHISLGPVTPIDITINIANIGPRTAKFALNAGSNRVDPINDVDYVGGRNNRDLADVSAFVRASTSEVNCSARNVTLPLTYTQYNVSGTTDSASFTFQTPVGRSRKASALFGTDRANFTIRSVTLTGSSANVVFDPGQEFTKDSLHKLLIAYWEVTWGP